MLLCCSNSTYVFGHWIGSGLLSYGQWLIIMKWHSKFLCEPILSSHVKLVAIIKYEASLVYINFSWSHLSLLTHEDHNFEIQNWSLDAKSHTRTKWIFSMFAYLGPPKYGIWAHIPIPSEQMLFWCLLLITWYHTQLRYKYVIQIRKSNI